MNKNNKKGISLTQGFKKSTDQPNVADQELIDFSGTTSTTKTSEESEKKFLDTTTTLQPISDNLQSKIITDDFSINLPEGWKETNPVMGTTIMAVKTNEILSDPAAQKINFNSYFAISYDTLGEKTPQEYVDFTKQSLEQTIGDINFILDKDVIINNRNARKIEFEMSQQGVDFKVLLVLVKGEESDIWTISFNTTKSDWEKYENIFYDIASSFIVKI
jgi:hypothetical protein